VAAAEAKAVSGGASVVSEGQKAGAPSPSLRTCRSAADAVVGTVAADRALRQRQRARVRDAADFARNGLVFAPTCEMMLKDMLRLIERDDLVRREGELAPIR
jgi:hypothetical protein